MPNTAFDIRLLLLAVVPFFTTLLGGLAAVRLRHRLHPFMAFAAGVLVATALADLLPEAAELVGEEGWKTGAAAVAGFLVFSAIETLVHQQSWEHRHPRLEDPSLPHEHREEPPALGIPLAVAGPVGIILHSTLDGLAIGLAVQAGGELAVIVVMAVLAHVFADGLNVATLVLAAGRSVGFATVMLALAALAPLTGILLSTQISISDPTLGLLLAGFAGVFIAIGAGHLLPEAQHQKPAGATPLIVVAAVGAGVVLVARALIPE